MNRRTYINLAVRDLKRSMEFFRDLGFELNPKFSDDKAACLVIGKDTFAMLITEPFFMSFTKRERCDSVKATEVMIAVSCESKSAVDAMVNQAVASGGSHAMPAQDHGFMYGWSFYDPDGHHWEPVWLDSNAG